MKLGNFSPIDTGSKMTRKPKKPILSIETGPESPPRFMPSKSGLAIETSPLSSPKFAPSKSGLAIETNTLSSPRFAPSTSGLTIDISPPRFAIPMGTSPPLMTLGNLSPEHETIMTPTQKISEMKKYAKIFKEMAKDIMVTNPKNHSEKIELYKLFNNISKSLLRGGEYIFKEGYDKTLPNLGSTRRTRKYDGVYKKGKGKTYSITSNAYNNGPTEFTKQTCLSVFKTDYVKGFVSIVHEICLMYYAHELNKHRHLFQEEKDAGEQKLVVIPEIYKIELLVQDDGTDCINIHMEKIEEKKPKSTMRLEPKFNKWNGITTQIFQYFRDHNLAHLDTNPNNVFFTTDGKLAIIDFGESILPDTEVNLRQAKPTGYLKTGNTMAGYNEWLQGRKTGVDGIEGFHDHDDYWGGEAKRGGEEQGKGKTKTQKQRINRLRKTKSNRK
jgi:hypothetical protein